MNVEPDSVEELTEKINKICKILQGMHLESLVDVNVLDIFKDSFLDIKKLMNKLNATLSEEMSDYQVSLFDIFLDSLSFTTNDFLKFSFHCELSTLPRYNSPLLDITAKLDALCGRCIKAINLREGQMPLMLSRSENSYRKGFESFHLSRLVGRLVDTIDATEVVDVGCGKGHLTQGLQRLRRSLYTIGVDRRMPKPAHTNALDAFLRKSQTFWVSSTPKPSWSRFFRMRIPDTRFTSLLDKPYRFSVGLHSCGDLAVDHLACAADTSSKGALSIGCCYHLLSNDKVGISKDAHPLLKDLLKNRTALHMANLRHTPVNSIKSLRMLYRKRIYRLALEALLSKSDYWRGRISKACASPRSSKVHGHNFAQFVQNWITSCGTAGANSQRLSRGEKSHLMSFFKSRENRQLCFLAARFRMFQCRLIGKSLELLVHLDRALFMHQKFGTNHVIMLRRFFPDRISSRNIGILMLQRNVSATKLLS